MSKHLKNIVVFSEVCSQGNYRDASLNLGMSIATISRAIKELEEDSGVQFFINVKGEFKPTDYARSLYDRLKVTNADLVSSYNFFKSNSLFVNVLIPPQISSYNLVEKLVEFNEEFDSELVINEGINAKNHEDAYSGLISGEIDFILDDQPNNGMSFVSEKIGAYNAYLIASRKYYDSIEVKDIDENSKFAKYSWLGQTGKNFHQCFGIEPNSQVGIITQNPSNYFKVIKETRYIGICSEDVKKNIKDHFVFTQEPIMSASLYFITTKASLHNKPIVKWFYNNFKLNQQIIPGRDISESEMSREP
ncbi:LysR family transcriptional regulator [Vibrio coralliilyticus]|uniref:LysR family transcriptional regulator n=1 Tax=Vibrio coralliilyticus TaxID=190893 RepID=UPI001E4F6153|nr:LysR family transcriptional regulator [Vibrio coralliilyticus]MCC2525777.1 LysR family transcriptional regulator [Vibrio coralliilyticus]